MNERTLEAMPVNSLWMLREKIDALHLHQSCFRKRRSLSDQREQGNGR